MLYGLSDLDRYHHYDITTMERTARRIRSSMRIYFFIMLFILQKHDYMLHYYKDTTSIIRQKSLTFAHKLLHKSFHQASTKEPLIHPKPQPTMHQPHPHSIHANLTKYQSNLQFKNPTPPTSISTPQATKTLPLPNSNSCIKTKRNKSIMPLKNQTNPYPSQNHTLCIP